MLANVLQFLDRVVPDPLTMPTDQLVALYVIGISAAVGALLMAARSLVRDHAYHRDLADRHDRRIQAITKLQDDADARVFQVMKGGRS